jgi:rubredoxin
MDPQTCTDCKKEAPQTDSQYTLIGGKFGWRVQRRKTAHGWTVDWRCPDCWRVFKQSNPDTVSTQMPATPDPPASQPRSPRQPRRG